VICYSVHPSSRRHVTFQQDNAGPHVARVLRHYLTQQNVDVLPWPAVSPDLSPVELAWDEMERTLRYLQNQSVVSGTKFHKHFLAH
jgi:transposase